MFFEYLLIGLVVVIILLLIYYLITKPTDESRRADAEKFLNTSAGVFDVGARAALHTIDTIANPVPQDYFMRGYIIRHNILGADNVADMTADNRRTQTRGMLANYTAALRGMANGNRGGGEFGDEFMLREMERAQTNIIFDDEDVALQHALMNLVAGLGNVTPVVRKATAVERVQQAANESTTRTEAVEKYFDSATVYTNDPQNVHDSKVNEDLRLVYNKIKADNPQVDTNVSLNDINDYIVNYYQHENTGKQRAKDALTGLKKAREGGLISAYSDNEDRILAHVWERCNHPLNVDVKDKMQEAVVTSLADGIENSTQVCINGRCSRILNSLATLDFDEEVSSGVLTLEAYRNQIFQETKGIITKAIDQAKDSDDVITREVGEAYDTGESTKHTEAEAAFKNSIKADINENLSSYVHKLSQTEINNLKSECYMYALI